ncbi:MAG: DMT family transporter [Lachnospiraceae bacterium]
MKKNRFRIEYTYALISVACWGILPTISSLLLNTIDTMHVVAYSSLFAACTLFIYNCITGKIKEIKKLSIKTIIRMVSIGLLGMFFYNILLLLGIERMAAQEAFVINYLWPACIIIFSCLILKEKMTLQKVAAITLSFLGIVIITTKGDVSNFSFGSFSGMLFCVSAAVCYGLYSVLNKRETFDKNISVMSAYGMTAIISFIVIIIKGEVQIPSVSITMGLLLSGIICNAIPYVTWAWALEKGNTAIVSNLAYLTPFVSLVVTNIVLKEEITVYSIWGLLFIVSGIFIQMYKRKSPMILFETD